MKHILQRHPLPIRAYFRHSLVLTYAYPAEMLTHLLPPGLDLDTHGDLGFLAIAMVQTRRLRPTFVPAALGRDFCLTGYRVFAKRRTRSGGVLRGLRILRSDADRPLIVSVGNLLTHYNYRKARIRFEESDGKLHVSIRTPGATADLSVVADLTSRPAALPAGSPFRTAKQARRFAGPLRYTFDYEPQTHSIIQIEAARENWRPQPVAVDVQTCTFLDRPPFNRTPPLLANAFHVADVPYMWKRGVRKPLTNGGLA